MSAKRPRDGHPPAVDVVVDGDPVMLESALGFCRRALDRFPHGSPDAIGYMTECRLSCGVETIPRGVLLHLRQENGTEIYVTVETNPRDRIRELRGSRDGVSMKAALDAAIPHLETALRNPATAAQVASIDRRALARAATVEDRLEPMLLSSPANPWGVAAVHAAFTGGMTSGPDGRPVFAASGNLLDARTRRSASGPTVVRVSTRTTNGHPLRDSFLVRGRTALHIAIEPYRVRLDEPASLDAIARLRLVAAADEPHGEA